MAHVFGAGASFHVDVPIAKSMESLNVSNAAAIALYELRR